jgi:hypothetical protein
MKKRVNYDFERRKKELERQRKKEEKQQRKQSAREQGQPTLPPEGEVPRGNS